jgi:hypothetical protein
MKTSLFILFRKIIVIFCANYAAHKYTARQSTETCCYSTWYVLLQLGLKVYVLCDCAVVMVTRYCFLISI